MPPMPTEPSTPLKFRNRSVFAIFVNQLIDATDVSLAFILTPKETLACLVQQIVPSAPMKMVNAEDAFQVPF